ncbi:RHS repeat protein [Myxococcus sp. AM011]|uniref:RHS repeat-associated core domain-containing protein n=1 Tax=Myxococcus sp. AM011 TaxID=2745200 RepID=UPI00159588CA|nr:RHS repeat-associated core domain-containing protein [Myxococcus sp. AM011]NVJ24144.1 RHS repeat protein [Myxococcus sp. AM011]
MIPNRWVFVGLLLLGVMTARAEGPAPAWLDAYSPRESVAPVALDSPAPWSGATSLGEDRTRAYEDAHAIWESRRDVAQAELSATLTRAHDALGAQSPWWERFWHSPWPSDDERDALEQSREELLSARQSLQAIRSGDEAANAYRAEVLTELEGQLKGLETRMSGGYARAWLMLWDGGPHEDVLRLKSKVLVWETRLTVDDLSQVARIEKLDVTDLQEGVVGQPLPQPVTVRVTTVNGEPVLGATVTFKGQSPSIPTFLPVSGGTTPASQLSVLTDESGLASVRVLPDTNIPRNSFLRAGIPHGQRLGFNAVTAETTNGTQTFTLQASFVHVGLPDVPAVIDRLANVSAPQEAAIQLVSPLYARVFDRYGNACANQKVTWTQLATTGRFFRVQDAVRPQVLDTANPMQLMALDEWTDTDGWVGPGYIPGTSNGTYSVTATVGTLNKTVWVNVNTFARYTLRATSNGDFNGAYRTSAPVVRTFQLLRWPQNAPGWVPITGNEPDLLGVAVRVQTHSDPEGDLLASVVTAPSQIGSDPLDDDKTMVFRQRYLLPDGSQRVFMSGTVYERRANNQVVKVCCDRDLYSFNTSTTPTLESRRRLQSGAVVPTGGLALTSDSGVGMSVRNRTSGQLYARITVQPHTSGDAVLDGSSLERDADNDIVLPAASNPLRILPLLAGTQGGRVRFELYAKDHAETPPLKVLQASDEFEILRPDGDIVLSGLPLAARWMLPAWDFVSAQKPTPGQPPDEDAQAPVAFPARLGVKVFTDGRLVVSRMGTELASARVRTDASGITEVVPLSGSVTQGLEGFAWADVPPGAVGTEDLDVTLVPENPNQDAFHEAVPLTTTAGSMSKLPVAHTFVKGVSVVDGHLVKQATDVDSPSRGVGLAWTRTYSSGVAEEGLLGPGWSHGYEGAVLPVGGGFRYVVVGGEGSGHTFNCTGEGVGCVPQRGFHGTLRVEGTGSGREFIFRSKSGVEYRHGYLDTSVYPARYRLTSIVASTGHKVSLRYGDASVDRALTRIHDESSGRLLQLSHQRQAGHLRLQRVELHHATSVDATTLTSLNVCVQYDYDNQQRLAKASRYDGSCGSGVPAREESYSYESGATELGRTRMSQHVGPDGQVVRYTYHSASEAMPGEDAYLLLMNKDSRVKTVVETLSTQPLREATTLFTYSIAPESRTVLGQSLTTFATEVKGPRPEVPATRYRMIATGAVAELERPVSEGVVARTGTLWDGLHRTRAVEQDARGRVTHFAYDEKGNLTASRIEGAALPASDGVAATVGVTDGQGQVVSEVVEKWGYDASFNALVCHVDPEGYATVSRVDSTGDSPEDLLPFGTGRLLETRRYVNRVPRPVLSSQATCAEAVASLAESPQDVVSQWRYCGVENASCSTGALTGDWVQTVGADGHVESATAYDAYGQLQSKTLQVNGASTVSVEYVHDARGRLLEEQDGLGRHRVQEWDGLDRVVKEEQLNFQGPGTTRTLEYTAGGALWTEEIGDGFVRTHSLDAAGRRVRTRESGGGLTTTLETRFTYDEVGNRTSVTDRRGVQTSTQYDYADRPVAVTVSVADGPRFIANGGSSDEVGRVRTVARFAYDVVGNKVWESDVSGHDRTYRLDSLYRVIEEKTPEVPGATEGSSAVRYTIASAYDLKGQRVRQVDGNGHASTVEYDLMGRAIVSTDASGRVERRRHDARGNVTQVQWAAGGVQHRMRNTTYDGLNRALSSVETVEKASGQHVYTTQTVHDDSAHVEWTRNARGFVQARHFDGLGRAFKSVEDASGGPLPRQPDAAGVGPALNLTSTVEYDSYGRVAAQVDALGRRTETTHDALGRRVHVLHPMEAMERQFFDGEGNPISTWDVRGLERRFTFDALGRVRSEELVEGFSGASFWLTVSQRTYEDALGLDGLTRENVLDARNQLTVLYRDGLKREVRRVDAGGYSWATRFDALHKRQEKDAKGQVTRFTYDGVGRLLSQTEHPSVGQAATYSQSWSYDDAARAQTYVNRRGVPTASRSDGLGRKVHEVRGQGDVVAEESWTHDAGNNVVRSVDANGYSTVRLYDGAGRLLEETLGAGTSDAAATQFQYDAVGQLTQKKGPRATGASFDVRYSYDDLGHRVREENALNEVTVRVFDNAGFVDCEQRPNAQPTLPHGGAAGKSRATLTAEVCHQDGAAVAHFSHDEMGKRLGVVDAGDRIYYFRYDEARNLVAKQDANGNLTTYEYDARNLRTAEHQHLDKHRSLVGSRRDDYPMFEAGAAPFGDVGTLTWRYTYDENGNLASQVDPKGQRTVYLYDLLNRLRAKSYSQFALPRVLPSTSADGFVLDGEGNVTREHQFKKVSPNHDEIGESTVSTFDALDRVKTKQRQYDWKQISYDYDAMGHRTRVVDSDGIETTYAYDALGRLRSATLPTGTMRYHYWPDSLPKRTEWPNGVSEGRCYDAAGRLGQLIVVRGGVSETCQPIGQVLSRYSYTYDVNGNRLTQVEARTSPQTQLLGAEGVTSYGYDIVDRLTGVAGPDGNTTLYRLDQSGNRTGEREAPTIAIDSFGLGPDAFESVPESVLARDVTTTFNRVDWVRTIVDAKNSRLDVLLEYDLAGNLVKRLTGIDAVRTFAWDPRQTLTAVFDNGVQVGRYDYDVRLQRIRRQTPSENVAYVLDGDFVLQEADGSRVPWLTRRRYHYADGPLAVADVGTSTTSTNFLMSDALGSVTDAIAASTGGPVTEARQYDAWGNHLGGSTPAAGEFKLGFTGHQYDVETGLTYARARYYDSKLGIFISRDSFEGNVEDAPSLHRHVYARVNPLSFVDLDGHEAKLTDVGKQLKGQLYSAELAQLGDEQLAGVLRESTTHFMGGSAPGQLQALMEDREQLEAAVCRYLECNTSALSWRVEQARRALERTGSRVGGYLSGLPIVRKVKTVGSEVEEVVESTKESIGETVRFTVQDAISSKHASPMGDRFAKAMGDAAELETHLAMKVGGEYLQGKTLEGMVVAGGAILGGAKVEGALAVDALRIPGRVQSRINLAKGHSALTPLRPTTGQKISAGWDHVMSGHFNKPLAGSRSVFSTSPDRLRELLQHPNVVSSPVRAIPGGQYVRTVDTGEVIGNTALKFGGGETSWIEVFTDRGGNLITTYPVPMR